MAQSGVEFGDDHEAQHSAPTLSSTTAVRLCEANLKRLLALLGRQSVITGSESRRFMWEVFFLLGILVSEGDYLECMEIESDSAII